MEMSNEEWEYTFDPIRDLEERWGISGEEAEEFLEEAGYFSTKKYRDIAEVFNPIDMNDQM